jgi:formate dehydrogenase iron-sulfur subunit
MLGTRALQVFDQTVSVVRAVSRWLDFYRHESCGKCTPCRIGSMRGVQVLDRIIARRDDRAVAARRDDGAVAADLEVLDSLCDAMTKGSLCAMGGMTPQPVLSALTHFPGDFERDGGRR